MAKVKLSVKEQKVVDVFLSTLGKIMDDRRKKKNILPRIYALVIPTSGRIRKAILEKGKDEFEIDFGKDEIVAKDLRA